jgi:signal transduction histidine kinase
VTDLWQRVKQRRFRGVTGVIVRLLDRFVALLEIPTPDADQVFRRITMMERDIFLPLKAAGIAMLLYSFNHGQWIRSALDELSLAVEWTGYFLWYYIPANLIIAGALLAMRRLPLGLIQWVVFVSGLLDVILVSALIVLTLDYQSFLYWLYLALIVRSAVSVPRATSQLVLHFTIIICCVMVGVIQASITTSLYDKFRAESAVRKILSDAHSGALTNEAVALSPNSSRTRLARHPRSDILLTNAEPSVLTNQVMALRTNASSVAISRRPRSDTRWLANEEETSKEGSWLAAPLDRPAEPLLMRLALLVLMSVCSYGVQVLFERQRKAEEEAREFAMREGQLHAAGRLAAEFAHQIKNPLAIINNASFSLQRALKQGRTPPPDQIGIIQEEVEHADKIITQIMGYAQLSEGRVEKLDVIEELERAIAEVFPPAAGYPVQIHRDYAAEFPPLLMQRRHVSETFVNVLQNAREAFHGQPGKVVVEAGCRPDYTIEVSIRDDGSGIPPEKQERIFEAYYTTKEKGTGLGLATVKHDVELYGGSVRVESALGKGARFILLFPGRTQIRPIKPK